MHFYISRFMARRQGRYTLLFLLAFLWAVPALAQDAKEHFNQGVKLYREKQLDAALSEFQKASKLAPDTPVFLYWIGFLHLQLRQYQQAIEPLQRAIQLKPEAPEAYLNLGNAYDGLATQAAKAKNAEDETQYANAAIEAFKKVAKLQPNSADPYYNLGGVYFKRSRRDKKLLPEAVAAYQKAVTLNPKDAYIQDGLGEALLASGDTKAAISAYENATKLMPQSPNFWFNLGLAAQSKATQTQAASGKVAAIPDWEKARTAFARAVELAPTNYQMRETYAEALFDMGRDAEAVTHFEKASELNPKQFDPLYNLALALARMGKLAPAAASYRSALALRPESREAQRGLGTILYRQGQYDEAAKVFIQLTKQTPEDLGSWMNLSSCRLKKGDVPGAIEALEEAIKIGVKGPRVGAARRALATLYYRKGDTENLSRAQEEYTRSLEDAPDNAEALNGLGLIAQKQKRTDDAIAYFKRATVIAPRFADAHNNLGVAYEDKGSVELAIACYRKTLQVDPKHALAKKNLSRFPNSGSTNPSP